LAVFWWVSVDKELDLDLFLGSFGENGSKIVKFADVYY
jgi:hypothetical protein